MSSSSCRPFPLLALAGALAFSACGDAGASSDAGPVSLDTPEVQAALDAIGGDAVERHMRVLADDSLEGRGPGTPGFEGALRYVEGQLRQLGVQPAGVGGTYRQPVLLRGNVVVEDSSAMVVETPSGPRDLVYDVDFYLSPDRLRESVRLDDAPVVFVGYGVSAPDLGYDDYGSGVSVEGKVVAFLSGAPASLPSNERAYFSGAVVKEAEAVRRGAVGTITFNAPDDPRFRWDVSIATAKTGTFSWLDEQGKPNRGDEQLRGAGALNQSGVEVLFAGAPQTPEQVFAAAAASTPQAFDLATRVSMVTRTALRRVESANLVGRIEGSDPALAGEHVVYIGHVDHFGRGAPMNGDSIYNGAHDNASGVAIVLEIARAFKSLPAAPRRSVLFLFPTAEEFGLLGSDYFARNPTVPKAGIVASLALDMPFLFHPLLDIVPYGAQHSSLIGPVTRAAEHMGLALATDPIPEQVLFIRSDHYSFVRQGVPSLFIKSGFQTGSPSLDGAAINAAYRRDVYHKPNDDLSQPFDWNAGASHAKVNFLTGYLIAQETARPAWNAGDFFGGLFGAPQGP
jgi:Zn-dependent M28 family amino/carboxypeptidase